MPFEPWMLAMMDQAGYNGIREEHIVLSSSWCVYLCVIQSKTSKQSNAYGL